jgi:D-alanyl-D-alanine carboxypeptidase
MTRTRTALLCAAVLLAAALPVGAAAGSAAASGEGRTCTDSPASLHGTAREVVWIARKAQHDLDLKAVLVRVDSGSREVVTRALGETMTGVPAQADMHFRSGSVGIAYMATVLLQLVQEGRVHLDDPVARWLPWLPHGRQITLRMLGSSTSGLHDYVTDPKFLAELESHPFRHWTPRDVLAFPLSHPLWYKPGTNWSYSHANFQLLGLTLEKITGTRLDRLLEQRVLEPLDLDATSNGYTPEIPGPVLHAFTGERGTYEESTYWNPSWTTAPGAVETTDICDLARSARGIGTGELLSPRMFRIQLNPGTVGLGKPTARCPKTVCLPNTEAHHFGFGVIISNGWILQNPSFSGYAAIQAYLPAQRLSIAVSATEGPTTPSGNAASMVAELIAKALAPSYPLTGA